MAAVKRQPKQRADLLAVRARAGREPRARARADPGGQGVLRRRERVEKAGDRLAADAELSVRGEDHPYVSRGGVKLQGALDAFGLDPTRPRGRATSAPRPAASPIACCRRGAPRVYAIDVGRGQLHDKLRRDPRVVVMERVNARHLRAGDLPEPLDWVVIDASFIGLRQAAARGARAAARRAARSSRWSSRSSRSGASASARAASCATSRRAPTRSPRCAREAEALGFERARPGRLGAGGPGRQPGVLPVAGSAHAARRALAGARVASRYPQGMHALPFATVAPPGELAQRLARLPGLCWLDGDAAHADGRFSFLGAEPVERIACSFAREPIRSRRSRAWSRAQRRRAAAHGVRRRAGAERGAALDRLRRLRRVPRRARARARARRTSGRRCRSRATTRCSRSITLHGARVPRRRRRRGVRAPARAARARRAARSRARAPARSPRRRRAAPRARSRARSSTSPPATSIRSTWRAASRAAFEGAPLALWLALRAASPVPFGFYFDDGARVVMARTMERFLRWQRADAQLCDPADQGHDRARAASATPKRRAALRARRQGARRARDDRRPDAQRPRARRRDRQRARAGLMAVEPYARLSHLVSTVSCRTRPERRAARRARGDVSARQRHRRAQAARDRADRRSSRPNRATSTPARSASSIARAASRSRSRFAPRSSRDGQAALLRRRRHRRSQPDRARARRDRAQGAGLPRRARRALSRRASEFALSTAPVLRYISARLGSSLRESSKGRTAVFGAAYRGSNPCSRAT